MIFVRCNKCKKRILKRKALQDLDFNEYYHKKCWIEEFGDINNNWQ